MKQNKDFIDFLIELIHKKRLFFIVLLLCLSYAAYFDNYKNDKYKFNIALGIASESTLLPIISNMNVFKTDANAYLTPIRNTVNYEEFSEELCRLIQTTFLDDAFFIRLTEDFLSENSNDLTFQENYNSLKGSLKRLPSDESVCVIVEFTSIPEYINFLQKNYQISVNSYIQNEISTRLEIVRSDKIASLQETLASTATAMVEPSRTVVLDKLELNSIEERQLSVRNLLEFIQNTKLIDSKINYIIGSSSSAERTLNNIFIFVFSVFMSIIFFVLTVVLIEFKDQYKFRNSLDG